MFWAVLYTKKNSATTGTEMYVFKFVILVAPSIHVMRSVSEIQRSFFNNLYNLVSITLLNCHFDNRRVAICITTYDR